MPGKVPLLLLLSLLSWFGTSHCCLQDPASAYRFTGAVCRLTYPAAVVLNEKTTKVIEAAFQHARYPSMKGEKSLLFIGKVMYGLDNLEIHNLSIGQSAFELHPGEGIAMEISNVSAVFKGSIQYGYGSWLVNFGHSVDFEIDSQIDLGINPKLYCGDGKVAADTADCYLNFHKLRLHLQGDKEPNWLKKLFTDFITLTVKLVIKGQICKEINKAANILADFIQDTAEQFLTDGDISVDIGIAAAPVITANYIESYHKGLTKYNNKVAVINESVFQPSHLTEDRMIYFWISDQFLNPMLKAAHQDGRFQLNVSGEELTTLLRTNLSTAMPELIRKCLLDAASPELRLWSSSVPHLNSSTSGTTVWVQASGRLHCEGQGTPVLFFQTDMAVDITTSYVNKKVLLQGHPTEISAFRAELPLQDQQRHDEALEFLKEAVVKVGTPKVLSVLGVELTRLLDKQGLYQFDVFNPEVLPRDGFVVIQMDFGFPHHLLVEFLKRTLQ
uniref:Cholesteryl ester transfer protein n=1 Tax=Maylandia zebra TaxID=106582 RepID=A0A3P9B162_9CICH|nr:cholesteryl ester transfer protein [Maylandia zebra]XP_023007842.2 cholesteryl ester transfer protein [Maylandia zebra]XP_023007843.2 cholesteryl ester transfer protein [Maylandia zebra]